jgi:formylglycine-generating enzyme required for sulfatase activity
MTQSPESSYPIAKLKALLSQRVGLDLSAIELSEILWLALQKGAVGADVQPSQPTTEPFSEDSGQEQNFPADQPPRRQEQPETAAVVAEPPKLTEESKGHGMAQAAGTGLPISIPQAVALRNRRQIARSLRPLMRKVPSKLRQAIDEEATIVQIAETQTWNPVVKPEPERWLELAIVIEVTNLVDVWHDTIAEFQHLMERHGAFRDVRTWQLKPNAVGDPQLFLQTASGLNRNARSPKELLDAGGRRLVLLLSDCTSRAWRSGKIPQLLELWSRENPVTIVQLLPERYWDRSALKLGYRVALRSRLPGALSRDWVVEGLSPQRRQRLSNGLKIPVVTIQPRSLGEWARAIVAIGEQQTTGILLALQALQTNDSVELESEPLTAKQLVRRFRSTASPQAQELADMMAVLPVNWSVIRLIQKNLMHKTEDALQETGALALAEIFLSGLLRPMPMAEGQDQGDRATQSYDFVEGVRDILLGAIPISEAQEIGEEVATVIFRQLPPEIQERVAADIERRFGDSLSYFEAFLIPDLPWGKDARAEILPFARVTGQVLRRWGGDYAALAEELEQTVRYLPTDQDREVRAEAYAMECLRRSREGMEDFIARSFSENNYEFQLNLPPDEASMREVERITLANNHEIAVRIADSSHEIIDIEGEQATFILSAEIRFAVEVSYFDSGSIEPEMYFIPTLTRTLPNQVVEAIVDVRASLPGITQYCDSDETLVDLDDTDDLLRVSDALSEDIIHVSDVLSQDLVHVSDVLSQDLEDYHSDETLIYLNDLEGLLRVSDEVSYDLIIESLMLSVAEPILVNVDGENQRVPDTPTLQTFEFEVAVIDVESQPVLSVELEPFNFEAATIAFRQPPPLNTETALQFIENLLTKQGRQLNDLQRQILRGAWNGETYKEIHQKTNYAISRDHLMRNVGPDLWRRISESLDERVSFKNLKGPVERAYYVRESLLVHLNQRQGQQFVETLSNGIVLEMVQIPSGSFVMGAPQDEEGTSDSERPQRQVTVSTFLMGKYSVTQAQWRVVAKLPKVNQNLDPDPSHFKGGNRPVENVSWFDAVEFCDRLSRHTGRTYRLPSEAEWEYACRAETTTPFHFGETITTDLANYDGKDDKAGKWSGSYGRGPKGIYRQETTPVGSFKVANNFGLYDMHGNVWEWCADHWHSNYEGAPTDGSAWLTDDENSSRIMRGGSWYRFPRNCRSACRKYNHMGERSDYIGFRAVCSTERTAE